jgi:hypothetical protein
MLGLNATSTARVVESFQSFVLEALDHVSSVTPSVTSCNQPAQWRGI